MTATPDTPQPPGSQRVDGWETNAGKTFRYFEGQPRGSAAEVKIGGFQNADGTFAELVIHVAAHDGLDLAGAQELIDHLVWPLKTKFAASHRTD